MHGLLLDANLSRKLARSLAARGNRVVLLDLLGHGRSDKPRHASPHRWICTPSRCYACWTSSARTRWFSAGSRWAPT